MRPVVLASHGVETQDRTAETVDWASLYEQYGAKVFAMLRRMTGDSALAEDLTHDTFVRIHHARHNYRGDGPAAAWLFRIAANLARDALRRGRTRDRHAAQPVTDPRSDGSADLRLALARALAALDPEARTVVLLHEVDGFSHRDIAEALGIQEGSSRAKLSRARAQLRAALADYKGVRR